MFTFWGVLTVLALAILAIIVVVKVKEFVELPNRRDVASPYGMIRGPSDSRLRHTRAIHTISEEEESNGSETQG